MLPGHRKVWLSWAAVPGCHCRAREKAQGLYFLSSLSAFPHPNHVQRPLSAELFLDFSSCFLPFQSWSYLCSRVCSPPLPTTSRLCLTCLHLSLARPSLSFSPHFLLCHSSLSTHQPCDGNLRPSRPWGERSPVVHIQAAAFPISPRVSVFPPSTLSVCPSVTLLPSPAALPLHAPLLAVPLRAFQDSHKSFLPSKLAVSSGRFT